YIKRILRIFPVLYLYLFVLSILNYFFDLNISLDNFLGAAFYISNFSIFEGGWYTGHSWTLAVEEQYYLIWPFIFSYVINRIWILVLFLFVVAIMLKALWYYYPFTTNYTLEPFLNHVNPIFMGALFSILSFKNCFKKNQSIWYNKVVFISCVVMVIGVNICAHYGILGIILLPFGGLISNLIVSFLIIRSLIHSNSYLYNFLNTNVMVKIGVISYSIYIWQQVFLSPSNVGHDRSLWELFPLNIVIALIVSYLSYTYYESYFLNLKKRFQD
ncbi:acyltransferase, partial [bacterium]